MDDIYFYNRRRLQGTDAILLAAKAKYGILPSLQLWTANHVYPQKVQAGIQKRAFLTGGDMFVSLEQLAEESRKNEVVDACMQQRFFNDYNKAINWFVSVSTSVV
ncbi:MAG: hypothetical protein NZM34_04695 [Bernardetiaceae bacterium]|nr:hypothetical protein [Bernardetiaceae bacterium]